jgi:hypothetical protein
LAVFTALLTLYLNKALGSQPQVLLLGLFIAALMSIEIGLIFGTVVGDVNTLFTLIKTSNIFISAPVIFYLFPSWPQWIVKIFPKYWIINPIFETTIKNGGFTDVLFDFAIAVGIIAIMIGPIMGLGQHMRSRLATS